VIDEEQIAFVVRTRAKPPRQLRNHTRPGQHSIDRETVVIGRPKLPNHAVPGHERRAHSITNDVSEAAER
jgi:hypothetical protein